VPSEGLSDKRSTMFSNQNRLRWLFNENKLSLPKGCLQFDKDKQVEPIELKCHMKSMKSCMTLCGVGNKVFTHFWWWRSAGWQTEYLSHTAV